MYIADAYLEGNTALFPIVRPRVQRRHGGIQPGLFDRRVPYCTWLGPCYGVGHTGLSEDAGCVYGAPLKRVVNGARGEHCLWRYHFEELCGYSNSEERCSIPPAGPSARSPMPYL